MRIHTTIIAGLCFGFAAIGAAESIKAAESDSRYFKIWPRLNGKKCFPT
jgi:hypothetical protein